MEIRSRNLWNRSRVVSYKTRIERYSNKTKVEWCVIPLMERGIVVKPTKGGHGDKFDTIPIYMVGCRFPYHE